MKKPKLSIEVETITPPLAAEMLKLNRTNRPPIAMHVRRLARDMTLGRWNLNGAAIVFSDEGFLLDGQHRLMAIVDSGCTVNVLVCRGVAAAAFSTIDTGKTRSWADTLGVKGEVDPRTLGATLRIIECYISGYTSMMGGRMTNIDVIESLERHPDARRSVAIVKDTKGIVPRALLAGLHYLFARLDGDLADSFCKRLVSGEGLSPEEPIYRLRERFIQIGIKKSSKFTQRYTSALIIKAWNFCRAGINPRTIKWAEDEAFPKIK